MSLQTFGLGLRLLKRMCEEQQPLRWHKAKLVAEMFKGGEVKAFEWISNHVTKHHALPHPDTLVQAFPEVSGYPTPEPVSYYLEHVENRLYYEKINAANIESQKILKESAGDYKKAVAIIQEVSSYISTHQYRNRIIDLVKEGPAMALQTYHNVNAKQMRGSFGWPYLDAQGSMMGGEVITVVGRMSSGKTYILLRMALHNWRDKKHRPLFVSMEMTPEPLTQRIMAMYSGTPITQLKAGGFSSQTYKKFTSSLHELSGAEGGFYIVDGNLAASVDDIYILASQLKCDQVYIDGAYLLKHPNVRLDRFTKVAENIELIKQRTTDLDVPSICSYQLNRESKKQVKGSATKLASDEVGLEHIGMSDAIPQISSVVLGLFESEGIEALIRRKVRVMKGRDGQTGDFHIHWLFDSGPNMLTFDEIKDDSLGSTTPLGDI